MAQICYRDRAGNFIVIKNPSDDEWRDAMDAIGKNIAAIAGMDKPKPQFPRCPSCGNRHDPRQPCV